jgi:membrane protein implicated in regulation of membrane protease activity
MDWSNATTWWIVAGALVAAELASGTFYLLMLAVGCAAGAVAAHLGASVPAQLVIAAVLGIAFTAVWHYRRASQPRSAPIESNADANLDIGQAVHVTAWASDGTARENYRGASWNLRHAGPGTPTPGPHVIVAVRGNELSVAPAPRP